MVTKKQFGYFLLVSFVALTIWIGVKQDYFIQTISSGSLLGILLYFLSDYKNIAIITSSFVVGKNLQVESWKSLVSGAMIAIAADIVSFPRIPQNINNIGGLVASFDYIVLKKFMEIGMTFETAWFAYYYVVPIALIITVVWMIGVINFSRKVNGA